MSFEWKTYLQWQKPMAHVLTAAALPALAGVYNFGWRVAAVVVFSMAVCWFTEYLFTRKQGKPASMASLVTGILLALILPPNVPFWIVAVGAAFCITFGKMAFGGFGKNIYNPAMVGRCFLYICFPVFVVTTWTVPYTPEADGYAAGFLQWGKTPFAADTPRGAAKSWEEQPYDIDAVTSATSLRATKNLNREARQAKATWHQEHVDSNWEQEVAKWRDEMSYFAVALPEPKEPAAIIGGQQVRQYVAANDAVAYIPVWRLFLGNINGCMGETSALAILLGLAYLIYRKAVFLPLVIGPLIGLVGMTLVFKLTGHVVLPLGQVLLINLFAGGAMFAITFMTTEPVSAPRNKTARWIYAILIGIFAVVIRTLSTWPAGLMFSILLANTVGPIIEIGCDEFDAWRKKRAESEEEAAA